MKGKKTLQWKGAPRAKSLRTAERKQFVRPSKREVARRASPLGGGAEETREPEASHTAAQIAGDKVPASFQPTFVPCTLTGPDGSTRSGWEMWLGDHCFGRADSKKLLLASYARLQSPPSSFHWREVRRQRRSLSEKTTEKMKELGGQEDVT